MAAFTEIDWTLFDIWAVVSNPGVAVVDVEHRAKCRAWLDQHGYDIHTIGFDAGVTGAIAAMNSLFDWEAHFGYTLEGKNLDALRDGFEFTFAPNRGVVLELLNAHVGYREDPEWMLGVLSIASEYSRTQLALGNRFFVAMMLDRGSPREGAVYEKHTVPVVFSTAAENRDPFS